MCSLDGIFPSPLIVPVVSYDLACLNDFEIDIYHSGHSGEETYHLQRPDPIISLLGILLCVSAASVKGDTYEDSGSATVKEYVP